MKVRVLFVCLGNICRSPTAHGIFEKLVYTMNLDDQITVDSAGTGDWHIGHPPDQRATAAALKRGYDLTALRARQVSVVDFQHFDYVLAMDNKNLEDLQAMCPENYEGELALFLQYAESSVTDNGQLTEVPDPYFGGEEGFDQVLDMVESASHGLIMEIMGTHLSIKPA